MIDAGVLVDLVIAVLAMEVVGLLVFRRRLVRLPATRRLLPNLAAGLFLVLAVRSAVHQDGAAAIGAFLALGGIAHWLDLRSRRT